MFCVDNLGMVYIKHSVTTQHTWQYTQDVNSFLTSESKSFQLLEQLKRGSWQTQQNSCTFIKEQTESVVAILQSNRNYN